MKTLQNNYTTSEESNTTHEQSKWLLEFGLPADSADYYFGKNGKIRYIDGSIPYSLLWAVGSTPCWSSGRLKEILKVCLESKLEPNNIFKNIEECINTPETLIQIFKELKEEINLTKLKTCYISKQERKKRQKISR